MKIRRDDQVDRDQRQGPRQDGPRPARRPRAKDRVYVEGLNIIKRHERPRQVRDAQRAESVGGVIEREGPIHVSNVALIDPKDNKPTRIGVVREDGKRYRVTRRSNTRID